MKSMCTCSAASAHYRLVESLQQVPKQTSQPYDKMGSALALNSLRVQSKLESPADSTGAVQQRQHSVHLLKAVQWPPCIHPGCPR